MVLTPTNSFKKRTLPIEEIERLMNLTALTGARVVAHCVPTRAFRVITIDDGITFRAEQFDRGRELWMALSTHKGSEPFEAFGTALEAAIQAQQHFVLEVRKAKLKQKTAEQQAAAGLLAASNG